MTPASRPVNQDELEQLTPREREVLAGLLQRKTYAEIAIQLSISWHTVNSHVKAIYQKLQVCSAGELRDRCAESGPDQRSP